VAIHSSVRRYGENRVGADSQIMENVILGYPDKRLLQEARDKNTDMETSHHEGVDIGQRALIRSGTVLYCRVRIGNDFKSGHNVLIREDTTIGDNVLIGTNVVLEGNITIGSNVSIQSNVYIPTNSVVEDFVFIGPNAVLTNDKYPIRKDSGLKGPVIRKGASLGANSTILPGVEIGEGAMVAAGALVTKDVPPWTLAIGAPARFVGLPDGLKTLNRI
jgi:acetyltransferase-like isoleucine patch superfamily enzyme